MNDCAFNAYGIHVLCSLNLKKKKIFWSFFSKNNFRVAKDKMCDKHDVAEIWLIHDIVFYRYCTHPFSFDIIKVVHFCCILQPLVVHCKI